MLFSEGLSMNILFKQLLFIFLGLIVSVSGFSMEEEEILARTSEIEEKLNNGDNDLWSVVDSNIGVGARDLNIDISRLLWRYGIDSVDESFRKEVVERLSILTTDPMTENYSMGYLLDFESVDFTEASISILQPWLTSNINSHRILLLGVVPVESADAIIDSILNKIVYVENQSVSQTDEISWAALRAKARKGNVQSESRAIWLVENERAEDDVVVRYLSDLASIRSERIVRYIASYLFKENSVNIVGPDQEKISDTLTVIHESHYKSSTPYSIYAAKALRIATNDIPATSRNITSSDVSSLKEWALSKFGQDFYMD